MKKFDLIKVVLPLKFMSFGCTMVTLGSETLLYMSQGWQKTQFFEKIQFYPAFLD